MLEVATVTIGTVPLLAKAETRLGLIRSVDILVAAQLLRSVRKLASLPIGTKTLCGEVLAKRALDLGTALVTSW